MPYGYTPPGRIVELNNLARLRRINGAFHSAVGGAMRYNLFTNERVLFDTSPSSSDVMRGVVNYLFRNGSLAPEQWNYTHLTLVDPPGGAQMEYDIGSGNTCVRFNYVTTNASLMQGFKLNCTSLFALYPAFTNTSWHANIVFKLDTALPAVTNSILFSPNGMNIVGLYLQGNNVVVMAADTLNDNWMTNTAPVSDGWASAFHRILVINNSGYLSVYVDGTLQLMKDATGAYTSNTIELGRASGPHTPPAAEWTIGNAAAHVNTMTFHLTSTAGYNTMQYKYIAVGDALTDPVVLNSTIQLTEPDQIDSFTIEQVRPAFVVKSTQEDDSVQGYEYPVKIGLQYGDAGAIELHDENTRTFYAGPDGVSGGKVVQDVIAANGTLDVRYMNVEYAVRTNLANAITVKFPTFTRAYPGTWLYFYDVDGGASSKNFTIDPDYANTGYTINGNTTAQTAITADWGAVEIFYDYYGNTDKNWILVKHAPTDMSILYSNAVNTTLGVPSGPGIFVWASAGAATKDIFLPLANTCAGKMFIVKKTDNGFNTSIAVKKAASSSDNFDTPDVTQHILYGKHDSYCYVSDGTTLWKTHAMCTHRGSEGGSLKSATFNTDLEFDQFFVSANATANLPLATNGAGRILWLKTTGNVSVTLDPTGSETIDNIATLQLRGKNKSIGLISRGGTTNWSTIGYRNEFVTTASTNSTIVYPARVVLANANAGITLTLPAALEYTDSCLSVKKTDTSANTITIEGNASETIDGALNYVLSKQYQQIDMTSDGSNWHIIGISEQMNIANVVGNVTVGNALAVTGNSQLTGALNVNGAVQFNSTLNATGAVIFSNALNVALNVMVNGYLQFGPTAFTIGVTGMSGNTLYGFVFQGVGIVSDWIVVDRGGNAVAVVYNSSKYLNVIERLGIGLSFTTEPTSTLEVKGTTLLNGTLNTVGGAVFNNAVNVNTANGIDCNPGSDIDVDLITVGVTGTPRLWWDEVPGYFVFTDPVQVVGIIRSGATQTVTGDATLNTNATLVLCNCAANTTFTLTAASGNDGRDLYIKRIDNTVYVLTVDGDSAETIDGSNTVEIIGQYESIHIRCDGSNWWIV